MNPNTFGWIKLVVPLEGDDGVFHVRADTIIMIEEERDSDWTRITYGPGLTLRTRMTPDQIKTAIATSETV